jgi:hypothetical protein
MTYEESLDNNSHSITSIVHNDPLGLGTLVGYTGGRFACGLLRVRLSAQSTYLCKMIYGTYSGDVVVGSVGLAGSLGSVGSVGSVGSM